jgi:hypothetical protein
MSSHKQTKPKQAEASTEKGKRSPSLEGIEEAETTLWVQRQLNCIRDCLSQHGADDEMLDAVDYLLEDNERWLDPQIADDLRKGKLRSGHA